MIKCYLLTQRLMSSRDVQYQARMNGPGITIRYMDPQTQLAFPFTLALRSVLILLFACNRVFGLAPLASMNTSALFLISALDFGRGPPTLILPCSKTISPCSNTPPPPLLMLSMTGSSLALLVESPNNIPRPSKPMFSFESAGRESRFLVGEFCSASDE